MAAGKYEQLLERLRRSDQCDVRLSHLVVAEKFSADEVNGSDRLTEV